MATTLATEKQANAIKQRMAEIRTDLPYEVDEARHRVKQLTDWKYHLSRHPLPVLGAAAVVGFLAVPSKSTPSRIVVRRDAGELTAPPAKRGLLGGIAGAVATMMLRQASAIAANQVSSLLSKRGGA